MNWEDRKKAIIARMKSGNLMEAEKRLLDVVAASPNGIGLLDLCRAAALGYEKSAKSLGLLRQAGLVDHNKRHGVHSLWCMPGTSPKERPGALFPRQKAVLDLVASSPIGLTMLEISEQMKRSRESVVKHMGALQQMGLVVNTSAYFGGARYARWVVPASLQAAIDHADKSLKHPRRAKREAPKQVGRGSRLGDSPTVRIVDAAKAKPIRPTGPVSVFHMGAM